MAGEARQVKNKRAQRKIVSSATLAVEKKTAGISAPVDFRQRKLFLTLWIMGAGMLIALVWNAVQGWVLGKGYPYNTFLFSPISRFGDLSDTIFMSKQINPYVDPITVYGPFTWLCLRPFAALPNSINMIGCFFISLAGLFLLLVAILRPVISKPAHRVLYSLLLMGISYPVLYCFDRGNIEIVLVVLIAGAIFFVARTQYILAMLCLVPAIGLKLYPAFLLVLLFRQRKTTWVICALLASAFITFFSLYYLSLPVQRAWEFHSRNLAFFTHAYFYENLPLEGSCSPWNAFKIVLISAGNLGLINPVDFSFDGNFIRAAYAVYTGCMILLAAGLAIYGCFLEKQFLRCAMALLLYLSLSAPSGGDYRLLYAGVALILLILLKTKRSHDFFILILLALAMVPKKEIFLAYAGHTETGFADVSIQVLLNPLLIFTALLLLLYDGRTYFDPRWTWLRLHRLIRAILPRLPGKSHSGIRSDEDAPFPSESHQLIDNPKHNQ
jgi:hypothetical protein